MGAVVIGCGWCFGRRLTILGNFPAADDGSGRPHKPAAKRRFASSIPTCSR